MLLDMTWDKRQDQANKTRTWSEKEVYLGSFGPVTDDEICVKPCRKQVTVTMTHIVREQQQNGFFLPEWQLTPNCPLICNAQLTG